MHDLVGFHVDQHAAAGLVLPPCPRRIGCSQRGDVARLAVAHRNPVQMAAILRRQCADKPRLPYRDETKIVAHLGQAGETCRRQPDLIADHRHVVRVQIARVIGCPGQIKSVVPTGLVLEKIVRQQRGVGQYPEIVPRGQHEPAARGRQPQRLVELAHQQRDPSAVPADHRHLAGLVRRNGHRSAGLRKPILKLRRRGAGNGNRCVCHARIVHRILIVALRIPCAPNRCGRFPL